MHTRKSLVAVIAILVTIVGAIPITVPRAHADDSYSSVTITGTLAKGITDTYLGGGYYDAIQAGNTLYFNLYYTANYIVFQRNLTMGVKFDWMQNYLNTTTPVTVFAYGTVTITLAVPIPNLSGQYSSLNLAGHPWTLQLWDMSIGSTWVGSCYDYGYYKGIACNSWSSASYSSQYPPIAIYSGAQAAYYNNLLQAGQLITAIQAELGGTNPPAGSSAAAADLAIARSQALLAENAYANGDFNTAQTDSQNSLNNANAAESSLATVGGGTDAATMTSIWLGGVAVIMGGIGALLLGFGGFKYMRGKTKTMSGYAPSPKA